MRDNPFLDIEKEKSQIHSYLASGGVQSLQAVKGIISDQRNGSFLYPLFVELIQRIENSLESIRKFTELSRGKFSDKVFGDHFQKMINGEVGKIDFLLDNVLNYIKVDFTVKKTNTIHTLLEEVIKKNQIKSDEKKIRMFKKFEKDLPETIVPDEHLKYILNSILQYAIVLMPLNSSIGIATRYFALQEEGDEDHALLKKEGRHIEISFLFDGYKKTTERFGAVLQMAAPLKEEGLEFELRLVDEIVRRNRGALKFEPDPMKARTFISLRFPVERRKVFITKQ